MTLPLFNQVISGHIWKSFKCNHCDSASAQSGNFRTHSKILSGEKSFKCKQCDFTSVQLQLLWLRICSGRQFEDTFENPSQFVQQRCAHCGEPGEVSAPGQLSGFHQAAQNSFSGAFQNSNPNFHFPYLPHQYIFIFQNQAPSKVKCHRTVLLQGSDSDRKAC